MQKLTVYLLMTMGLFSSIPSSLAEVRLSQNTLTVDVANTTIKNVLDNIGHQGNITIIALEETKIDNVRITKKFLNLSLEAGFDRLLSGWNYGISRNALTGKITTVYLVSQREDSLGLSVIVSSSPNPTTRPTLAQARSEPNPLMDFEDDTDSLDSEDEEADEEFAEEANFPNSEELANLPLTLSEHLEQLYRNDQG